MKVNFKYALMAFAALAMVACGPKETPDDPNKDNPDPEKEAELVLSETSKSIKVEESFDLTATVAAEFTVNKEDIVQLVPANDGKSVKVTGVGEGSAILTATTKGGQSKTCVVKVAKAGGSEGGSALKGSQIWPIILDGTTADANASKIVADFRPDDQGKNLWVWENTYNAGEATGLNFHGNTDGYLALVVNNVGWSGMGFCVDGDAAVTAAVNILRRAIIADQDNYFLHLAIKSTDTQAHTIYFLCTDKTKFVFGTPFDGGESIGDFARDGAWHEYDIPMSQFVNAIAGDDVNGANVFVALSGGNQGKQLNLDAVYFYKK